MRLLIARNPDANSRLPFLLRLPLGDGMVFRTQDTWPRTKALFCYPVPVDEWPDHPEIVEDVALRSCARRGAAIDVVVARGRENRSQIVLTQARGREACFWQSPRTRKQARPAVSTPTARAGGIADLQIVVDSHERYAYRFADQQATVVKRSLPCGDYGVLLDGSLVASVERKSMDDLVSSITGGRLRYALGELAALPRAAVVVEDRYSQVFTVDRVRPAVVLEELATLQVRWPNVPIVFCETRQLAQEWTYRFLAASLVWARTELAVAQRLSVQGPAVLLRPAGPATAPSPATPPTAQVRAWARSRGLDVSDRGRLRPQVWAAWHAEHPEQGDRALAGPSGADPRHDVP